MDINKIEEIYRDSYTRYNDLYNYFYNFCGFHILTTGLSLGLDVLRIRDYEDLNEIKKRKNVGYPPSPSSEYSRVGIPGDTWFYVSDDINPVLAEMLPFWYKKFRHGSNIKVIISIWHIRQPCIVLVIPELENVNEICKTIDLTPYYKDKDFWSYICQKFGTSTMVDKNIYEFTSAFSHALMDRATMENLSIDGIFYPSVQYPLKSNLALKKSVVDEDKIILKSLSKTEIRKSSVLNIRGTPNYKQICEFGKGYYEPEKDEISWS